ncbi:MAG: hypothetical protein OHK0056_15890 [Bacteriovoracaceae bacterium]
MLKLLKKIRFVIVLLASVVIVGYFGFWYYVDNYAKSAPLMSVFDYPVTSAKAAKRITNESYRIVLFISNCKKFPVDFKEFTETEFLEEPCRYKKFVPNEAKQLDIKNPVFPWNDPWGRSYQIRYDLERGKLQVRSRGRYLWWPWDDIIGETSLSIPKVIEDEMLDHCKKVPKDDTSCVFNRGWH